LILQVHKKRALKGSFRSTSAGGSLSIENLEIGGGITMSYGYNVKDRFADFGIEGNMVVATDVLVEAIAAIITENNEKLIKEIEKRNKIFKSE
jgi:hypothetical protein